MVDNPVLLAERALHDAPAPAATVDLVVRIGGESGDGVLTLGESICRLAARQGLFVNALRTFPAEIRGGQCMMQARISSRRVGHHGERVNLLIALDRNAILEHMECLGPRSALLCEAEAEAADLGLASEVRVVGAPFNRLAELEVGARRSKNIVAMAMAGYLLGLSPKEEWDFVKAQFASKGEVVLGNNLRALEVGRAYAEANLGPPLGGALRPDGLPAKLLMTGNEAVGLGALAAGVRCFFGYPITPSSEIMEYLSRRLPAVGGSFVQTEDEMAAAAGVVGASWAGAKAMTATSGPGLSLMMEIVGLMGMAEVPGVIVDCQRGGPSTGLPTKTEQSDLSLAVFGSHGEAPRVVLAPTSVEDCFRMTVLAFNIAEKYQLPVIMLSDQSLASRFETVLPGLAAGATTRGSAGARLESLRLAERQTPTDADLANYKRYRATPTGVAPMALPGTPGGQHIASSLEHSEAGTPRYDGLSHTMMSAKRYRKLEALGRDPLVLGLCTRHGAADAEIGVVSWGSAEGAVAEAVDLACVRGIKAASIHPRVLHPLPHEELMPFLASVRAVLVPELNFTGQLASLLRANYGIPTTGYNQVKTVPFDPHEILEQIEVLAHGC